MKNSSLKVEIELYCFSSNLLDKIIEYIFVERSCSCITLGCTPSRIQHTSSLSASPRVCSCSVQCSWRRKHLTIVFWIGRHLAKMISLAAINLMILFAGRQSLWCIPVSLWIDDQLAISTEHGIHGWRTRTRHIAETGNSMLHVHRTSLLVTVCSQVRPYCAVLHWYCMLSEGKFYDKFFG